MKKLRFIILITFCLGFAPLFGQMIFTDEDAGVNPRAGKANPGFGVMVPLQDVTFDQWEYLPLTDGLLLLAGLGGVYLLKKKRSKK